MKITALKFCSNIGIFVDSVFLVWGFEVLGFFFSLSKWEILIYTKSLQCRDQKLAHLVLTVVPGPQYLSWSRLSPRSSNLRDCQKLG